MRITNSMITANTKANININKVNADNLNTMVASGQKITRPSDDPVVAIRAMRFNTSLTELNQYYGKNIPDADAWYTDTEAALSQAEQVLSSMREKLNQASSEENVTSNVKDILEELKQLRDQYYAIGNADCAGRTVFTGYRTSEQLTFQEADKITYRITENISIDDLEQMDYLSGTKAIDATKATLDTYNEEDVASETYYRFRLSYNNLSDNTATFDDFVTKNSKGVDTGDGTGASTSDTTVGKTQTQIDDLYLANASDVTILRDTGEVIISKSYYDSLRANGVATIDITYEKTDWEKGDPRPEHYFQCETPINNSDARTYVDREEPDGTIKRYPVEYNFNRVDAAGNPVVTGGTITGFKEQELSYEIALNQTIQINTHANDAFSQDIGRDIDELLAITESVAAAETQVNNLQAKVDAETDDTKKAEYERVLNAAIKQRDLLKNKMHNMYTKAIDSFKGYSDDINKQIANVGALTSRLELTKNRVMDQQNNVKKLADENINADLTETALDYSNAQLALEAAQMAAGKIAKQTLLNYI